MKNRIKEILEEDVYHLFEDGDFNPLGHIDDLEESDDLGELGVELTKDCVLGFSNGNSKLEWPYLSLPAGYTCPFATMCKNFPAKWEGPVKGGKFKRPASWEKNVKPGPKAKFMCYAARAQGQYPGANIQAFKNLDLIKQFKTKEDIADLIIKSLQYHKIHDTDIFRIHEAGDFFSQQYFDAWIEVAKKLPGTLFYAYTVSLPFWVAREGQIPSNFKLIASMDEENEQEILDSGIRYSRVVSSVEEATKLKLSIDVDDSIAWGSDRNFALLIHGPQPKGSEAAQSLKRNKDAGMYGKEGVLSTAKQKNQYKKDELRYTIKKQLRGESRIVEGDFDWAEEIDPYEFITNYYNGRGYDEKHKLGLMASDYAHIKSSRKNISRVLNKMEVPHYIDITTLGRALIKYLIDNTSKIKRFLARFNYDSFNYEAGEFLHDRTKEIVKMMGNRVGESVLKEVDDLSWMDDIPSTRLFSEEFPPKINDIVRCLPNFSKDAGSYRELDNDDFGGSGYEEGLEFVVADIASAFQLSEISNRHAVIVWGGKNGNGVWSDALELIERPDESINEDMRYWGVDGDKLGPLTEIDGDIELSGHKEHDSWVFIHRNLHKPPYWSIKEGRSGGNIIGYDTDIWLTDVSFKVQQGGKERVRKEMRKNVHAGVVGKIKESGGDYNTNGWTLVTYNPYHHDSFVEYESGEPIYNTSEAILKNTKEVWVR